MDIRQLKYFLAIAEEGQITSAAKKLRMAQPPLSQQLKLLEDELGVLLVKRGPRRLQLTDAGVILRNRAQQIVDLTDSTVKEILDFGSGLKGTLSIGTVSSSGAMLMKDRIADFLMAYSGVQFEIHEGNTFTIMDLLTKGIIEVGIVRTPFKAQNVGCRYAELEPMIAVMTEDNDWNPEAAAVSVEELKGKPLILYRRFEQLIHETCLESGFEPSIFCKNDDARTTLLWANAGLGIGIVPRSAFELGNNGNLHCKEITSEALQTRIAAIWLKDKYISPIAAKFIDSFRSE